MSDLIDSLPGVSLPVGEVTQRLDEMWDGGETGSPSEFRASQMNLVLHFGQETSAEEASERFGDLIRFAQRYPSRIIVLCPSTDGGDAMRAKLFSQCYIGESHREMCCCEALLLAYQPEECGYLANQVSVWLESDLPTYHIFHRVPSSRIESYMGGLLRGVRRCIFDSRIDPESIRDLPWPEAIHVNDLARARLLPVRQAVGQYLSGYSIQNLCAGLKGVRVVSGCSLAAEAKHLLAWLHDCLIDCGRCEDCTAERAPFKCEVSESAAPEFIGVYFDYPGDRAFRWECEMNGTVGTLEAHIRESVERLPIRVEALSPEQTIAEALYF